MFKHGFKAIGVLGILVCILYNTFLFAQGPDTPWTKTYGGNSGDNGHSVQQTTDGGYIVAGSTNVSSGDIVVYPIKTNDLANSIVYDSVNHNLHVAGSAVVYDYEDFTVICLDATQFDIGGELC